MAKFPTCILPHRKPFTRNLQPLITQYTGLSKAAGCCWKLPPTCTWIVFFFIAGSRQAFIFVLPGPKITSLHVSKFTPNLSYKPTVNCISLLTAGNFVVFWIVFIAWRCFDMSIWFNFCASIFQRHHFVQLWNPIPKPEDVTGCRSCRGLGNTNLLVTDIDRHVTESPGGGGGLLSYITYTGMCSPQVPPNGVVITGYPIQRRFLERGIIFNNMGNKKNCGSRLYLLFKIHLLIMKKYLFDV